MRRILLWTTRSKIPRCFDDWFDVADWIKQENLDGRTVTIVRWEYI